MAVEIRHLDKSFKGLTLYRDFNFEISEGKVTAITGPSGCGKTTFLRMLAGLEVPDFGEILGACGQRRIGYVFQEDRLLPWLTVEQNLKLVIKEDPQAEQRTIQVLELMELLEFADYYPEQLSGGMKRRVAMGRALVYDGEITLMDEPFKGLDDKLKEQIQGELLRFWKAAGKTIVLVTHDREEASRLADFVYEFSGKPIAARRVMVDEET